jgi:hypothetical protein
MKTLKEIARALVRNLEQQVKDTQTETVWNTDDVGS